MKSKTIIISSQDENNKGRGILTLFQEDDLLQCRLRLYNVPSLNRYCKLGVYHQDQVYSANLLEKNGAYESSLVGDFDIDLDFYTAIIDTTNNNKVLLAGGTYAGFYFNDQTIFETETKETEQIVEQTTNTCEDCEKCKTCKYKEYFYAQQKEETNEIKTLENTTQEKVEENTENETKSIIMSIIPQFKYVFENYPIDETLNNLIPNSKFVKINENNEQYSIGAIYKEDEMKYICYAVLCNYNTPAPIELGEHYQWLPLDKEDPLSEGYFIVFQDANDLKIVEL